MPIFKPFDALSVSFYFYSRELGQGVVTFYPDTSSTRVYVPYLGIDMRVNKLTPKLCISSAYKMLEDAIDGHQGK